MNKNQNEDDFIPTKDHGNGLKSASLHIAQSFLETSLDQEEQRRTSLNMKQTRKLKSPNVGMTVI